MTNSSTDAFPLESYGYNLTQLAREGMFPPVKGNEAMVTRIFDILLRKEKANSRYNPVLIDEDETYRWPVVIEVLRRLAAGEAPDPLTSLQVIAPNFAALCGVSSATVLHPVTGMASEVEERLAHLLSWPLREAWNPSDAVQSRFEAFFSSILHTENQVLLLNDVHRFVLVSREPEHYATNVLNVLIPALARRQIQLLGISTLAPFRQHIERNAAIQSRVQPVMLYSPNQ